MSEALRATDESFVSEALRSIEHLSIVIVDRELLVLALHGAAFGRHGHEAAQVVGHRVQDLVPEAWERVGPLYSR